MTSLEPLRDVIARHNLQPRKSLGQNFLLDLNLTAKIARAAGPLSGRTVIEIGPGPGGLTRALLDGGADLVVAVEKDPRCVAALLELEAYFPGRLQVIKADALRHRFQGLPDRPVKIVANLPYNIASALLTGWLTVEPWPPWYEDMTLMFQREVAERLTAAPATKAYGRLSVLTQWRTQPSLLFNIDARAFTPPPKVTSAVVRFKPRPAPEPTGPPGHLENITRAVFGMRRKMLRSSLKALTANAGDVLERADIDETLRAEDLDVAAFCRLARTLAPGDK